MLTRCPHCQTAFRVTPEQLKVRQGQVRCGECRAVFDALDSLADETPLAAGPAMRDDRTRNDQSDQETTDDPVELAESFVALTPTASAIPAVPEIPAEPATPEELTPPPTEPPADATPVDAAAPTAESRRSQDGGQPAAAPAERDTVAQAPAEEEDVESVPATPPAKRWPWRIGALALLILSGAQLLYSFRVELAVLAPELRPALAAGCDLFGCVLPRPRKPELIGIETSDLAPAGPERLLLTATLKNRAPFDQEFPHLELTLTDTRDAALLRKVLAPADYLPAGRNPAAGFAARGDSAIRLTLEAPGVPAAGYRLYLFYP